MLETINENNYFIVFAILIVVFGSYFVWRKFKK